MPIYFSSNQLPALSRFQFKERQQIIALAINELKTPEKLILNLIRLAFLIPVFLFLAKYQSIWFFVSLFVSLAAYFFVMRPITFYFIEKYLIKAISKHQQNQSSVN